MVYVKKTKIKKKGKKEKTTRKGKKRKKIEKKERGENPLTVATDHITIFFLSLKGFKTTLLCINIGVQKKKKRFFKKEKIEENKTKTT